MEPNAQPGDDVGGGRNGIGTHVVEAAVACALLVIGLAVVFGSRKIGSDWGSNGPGAGYFPFYIGLIIIISSLGILYESVFGKRRNTRVFVDAQQLRRVMAVLGPALLYVLGIQVVGIYIASTVYIALFMIMLGKYSWLKSIIAALAVNVMLFLMFEVWFKVPLYKGQLDLLSFLGY